jgi:hypothetical protein
METPAHVDGVRLDMTAMCRAYGRVDPTNAALCVTPPGSRIANSDTCYNGPNSSWWIPGEGCVWNMVTECNMITTSRGAEFAPDGRLVCRYSYDTDECALPRAQAAGAARITLPPAGAAGAG